MSKNVSKYALIACERSQVECSAFREQGVIAFSCDIQACAGGHPEWHIQGDVTPFLKGQRYFYTADGTLHHVKQWDLIIAHPPCTYLSKAGSTLLFPKGKLDPIRYAHGIVAKTFFQMCLDAKANFVAVENPTPNLIWELPKPNQVLQPYEFGHPFQKRTLLWLRNLPPIMPEVYSCGRKSWVYNSRLANTRSRSFENVAKAMARQWTPLL